MDFSSPSADGFSFPHAYAVLDTAGIRLLAGDPDVVFPLASVTKPLVAYAVLIGIERGIFRAEDTAGPPGSTLRHLLAHASGLPPERGGALAAPGTRRIYSNFGYDLIAEYIAEKSGMPAAAYIERNLFLPLKMDTCTIRGSAAFGGYATLDSLMRFAAELLSPTLIPPAALKDAASVQFAGISGILPGYGKQKDNAWGLGFSIRGTKNPHWLGSLFSADTFGHFGRSGSFIWVDPQVKRAGVFLGARNFSREHIAFWPALTNMMRSC